MQKGEHSGHLQLSNKNRSRIREGNNSGDPLCLFCIKSSIWSFSPLPNVQMRADCWEEAADSHSEDARCVWARPWHVLSKGCNPWPFPKDTDLTFPHSFHTIQSRGCVSSPLARWLSDKGWRHIQWVDTNLTLGCSFQHNMHHFAMLTVVFMSDLQWLFLVTHLQKKVGFFGGGVPFEWVISLCWTLRVIIPQQTFLISMKISKKEDWNCKKIPPLFKVKYFRALTVKKNP